MNEAKNQDDLKKYLVTIEEHVAESFELFAENEEQARQLAMEKYNNGEWVLAPGEVVRRLAAVETADGQTEWQEF